MRRALYPDNWEEIVEQVRQRSGNCCEWCGAVNGEPHPVTGSRVVLTTAHLDHDKCANIERMAHLCQRCHLGHDRQLHLRNRRRTLAARLAAGQRDLFAEAEADGQAEAVEV